MSERLPGAYRRPRVGSAELPELPELPKPPDQLPTARALAIKYGLDLDTALAVVAAAEEAAIDPIHLGRVIYAESRWNPAAVNPTSGASGLIQFMPRCLSTDTLALTPFGWRRHDELKVGDQIVTFNATTGRLELDEVLDLYVGQATDCVRMHNKQFDFVATRNHRWYTAYGRGNRRRIEVMTSGELSSTNSLHQIIRAAPLLPIGKSDASNELCELIGVIVGDGSISRRDAKGRNKPWVRVVQSEKACPEVCDRIDELMAACGLRSVRRRLQGDGMVGWDLTGNQARRLLSYFDESTNLKVLNKSWLFSLSMDQLLHLRAGYLETDGSYGLDGKYPQFTQTESAVMDDFQLITTLLGENCNVRWDGSREGTRHLFPSGAYSVVRGRYYTYLKRRPALTEARPNRMHYDEVPGVTEVWCPTTRNKTWVAKRGGFVTVTGNTAQAMGTTVEAVRRMGIVQQLPYVTRYFKMVADGTWAGGGVGPLDTQEKVALAVFYPAWRYKDRSSYLPANVRATNPGINTIGDYVDFVLAADRRLDERMRREIESAERARLVQDESDDEDEAEAGAAPLPPAPRSERSGSATVGVMLGVAAVTLPIAWWLTSD